MNNEFETKVVSEVNFSGSVQMPEWVKGADGYTPVKGVDYWTEEELKATYDYLVKQVATIDWDDIDIDMEDVLKALREELAAVAFSNDYNDLANKPSIPSTVGLASEEYVDQKVANIDLSGYVLATALAKVATSGKYSDLSGVPTKVSQFLNDAGYLTQHQSLEEYAKKTYVDAKIANIPAPDLSAYAKKAYVEEQIAAIPKPDMTEYAKKTDIPEVPSLKGYATEEFVNDRIAESVVGGEVDLTDYAKKNDLPTKMSELDNDAGLQTADEVSALIAADLVNYYTKSATYSKDEVDGLISQIPKFKIAVRQERPTYGVENTVYLIPSTDVDDDNMYVEYIYVEKKWEKLGAQKFDLTGYATEEWVGTYVGQQGFAKMSDIPDVSGFQTAEMVQAAITSALGGIKTAEEGAY